MKFIKHFQACKIRVLFFRKPKLIILIATLVLAMKSKYGVGTALYEILCM